MTKLTLILDASVMSHAGCYHKLWRLAVDGYRSKLNTVSSEFGTAFHKFRSIFRETGDFAAGCIAAREHLKNTEMVVPKKYSYLYDITYLLQICTDYAHKYGNDTTYKPRKLEGRFIFPYYIDDYIEVAIAGTVDEVGVLSQGGMCYICDCKTTSAADEDTFLKQYRMSHQMMFYHWALRQYSSAFKLTELGKMVGEDIAIMIDGVFTHGKDNFNLRRSELCIPPKHVIEQYERSLLLELRRIIDVFSMCHRVGRLPDRDGILHGLCSDFGLCSFFGSCASPDEDAADIILKNNFIQKPYNPMEHQT